MNLDEAIRQAHALLALLKAELDHTRAERELYRKLDTEGLFRRITERELFQAALLHQEQALGQALQVQAQALGLPTLSLATLIEHAPEQGAELSACFTDLRLLAQQLKDAHALNQTLLGKSLSCVRGLAGTLSPHPSAYGRMGSRLPNTLPSSSHSTRA